jgi:central glycolytic genes regulator
VAENNWTSLLQRMAPEAMTVVESRYKILRQIRLLQPVGRRMLADVMQSTERIIRREVEFLREQRLIDANRAGMYVTADGENMIDMFHSFWKEVGGIGALEVEAARRLAIRRVVIVPGNADENQWIKDDLARQAAAELARLLTDDMVVAVGGGTTVSRMSRYLNALDAQNVTLVPARGALGDEVEIESNTVTTHFARSLGASYRLLYLPDVLEEETLRNVQRDPVISSALELIQEAKVLVHGIGAAEEMSRRRGLNEDIVRILKERNAVSEVFGYYFNRPGELVYRMNTVGMQMENVHTLDTVLAIAGGKSKAEAILSYIRERSNYILVTDEAAVREMFALLEGIKNK